MVVTLLIHAYSVDMTLSAKNISFGYTEKNLCIDNVSVNIPSGHMLVITGPNGSGKTTLLKLLSGLITPLAGSIDYKNTPVCKNMASFAWHDTSPGTHQNLTIKQIEEFEYNIFNINGLKNFFNHKNKEKLHNKAFYKLSSGEQKKTLLNLTLNRDADIFFFDEPEASLDFETVKVFYKTLENKIKNGAIAVIATHFDMRPYAAKNTSFITLKAHEDE